MAATDLCAGALSRMADGGFVRQATKGFEPASNPHVHYAMENSTALLPIQEEIIEFTKKHELGPMLSCPMQQRLISTIIKIAGAKKAIEIGVYLGYSGLTVALALPEDGKLVACEINEEYANIARNFWKKAGVDHKIDLRLGPAAGTLKNLIDNGESGTYDYVFIDADKESLDHYYEQALVLVRQGGIIVIDNVIWNGKVMDKSFTDEETVAIRKVTAKIRNDPRVNAVFLTVGDGTLLVYKL